MAFELKPPLFIFPKFGGDTDVDLARQIGLYVGPLARTNKAELNEVPLHLMKAPEGWSEISDIFGTYLIDQLGRRRVHVANRSVSYFSYASLLTRFAIQEWDLANTASRTYVRRTMGGEENIFHYRCVVDKHQENGVLFQHDHDRFTEGMQGKEACRQWLQKHYPNWKNPLAYWDE